MRQAGRVTAGQVVQSGKLLEVLVRLYFDAVSIAAAAAAFSGLRLLHPLLGRQAGKGVVQLVVALTELRLSGCSGAAAAGC